MKQYQKHTMEVREKVFMFAGFDDWHREFVKSLEDGDTFLLVDGVLHCFTGSGEPDCPLHATTKRFNDGFYLGHGSFGNGTVYWDKRSQEFGDYKTIGQVTDSNELIIKTKDPVLVQFMKTEAGGKK